MQTGKQKAKQAEPKIEELTQKKVENQKAPKQEEQQIKTEASPFPFKTSISKYSFMHFSAKALILWA